MRTALALCLLLLACNATPSRELTKSDAALSAEIAARAAEKVRQDNEAVVRSYEEQQRAIAEQPKNAVEVAAKATTKRDDFHLWTSWATTHHFETGASEARSQAMVLLVRKDGRDAPLSLMIQYLGPSTQEWSEITIRGGHRAPTAGKLLVGPGGYHACLASFGWSDWTLEDYDFITSAGALSGGLTFRPDDQPAMERTIPAFVFAGLRDRMLADTAKR